MQVKTVTEVDGKFVADVELRAGEMVSVRQPLPPLDMRLMPWVILPLLRWLYSQELIGASALIARLGRSLSADGLTCHATQG